MLSNTASQESKIEYTSKGSSLPKAVALARAQMTDRGDSPDLVPGSKVEDVFSRPSDLSSESDRRTTMEECRTTLELFNATSYVPRNRFVQPAVTGTPHSQTPADQGDTKDEGDVSICKPGCLPVPKYILKAKRSWHSLTNNFKQDGEQSEDKRASK